MHKKFICSSIDVVIFMKVIYGELLIILKLFYLILLYLSIVGNPWSVLLKLIDHIHQSFLFFINYSQSTNEEAERFNTWRYKNKIDLPDLQIFFCITMHAYSLF